MDNLINPTAALLDKIIKNTVTAIEESKLQIFDISESARKEEQAIDKELENAETEAGQVIHQVDKLEIQYRIARLRLAEVSRNFHHYTEESIRQAYEGANQKQLELFLAREREGHLRKRRDELQLRRKNLSQTVQRAEGLTTQVGVVLDFLTGDLNKLGAELEKAQHQQMLGLKIMQAQEEERKRVAREIHDGPAQMMAHIVFRAEIAERLLSQDVELAKQELHELRGTVRSSLTEVRKIIFDLRPMALDDLGLLPTLRKYINNFQQRYQITCDLKIMGRAERLTSSMEVVLFRLIQETLSNVAKHAKADEVDIRIEFRPERVVVVVRDDGIGFEYTSENQCNQSQFGLIGMRERVELLEGKMGVQTASGCGTRVMFNIPTKRSNSDAV